MTRDGKPKFAAKQIQLIHIDLDQLIPDPSNPNKMSEADYNALRENIAEHGFWDPILIQKDPDDAVIGKEHKAAYHIVDGHHRVRAAGECGHKSVPAVAWDGSEEMRRAFAIGMNKLRGELDLAGVQAVLSDLHADGWAVKDLTVTGYDEDEIKTLLKAAAETAEDADSVLEGAQAGFEEPEEAEKPPRPFLLELTFGSAAELQKVKRGLRRAAGKGRELGEGLLALLGETE